MVERIAVAHRDPTRLAGLQLPQVLPRATADSDSPLHRVLLGGETVRVTEFPAPHLVADPLHREQLALFHRLGAADALIAPLRARGRTLGALTIVRADPTDVYGPGDVQLLDDLARRAALAVDNARLFTEQRRFASELQQALLPRLPASLPGLELAARYQPASDLSEVGGDWYDAFELADGSVALAIGDVGGHDVHAATQMGAVRHKLRALAADRLAEPSEIIARLDRVVQHFVTTEFTTAIYARVLPGHGVVQWSNAGHLPPVLVYPNGPAVVLPDEAGLPLGIADLTRTDRQHELPDGAILLLYTDGLIERAGLPIDESLDQLVRAATAAANAALSEFCDKIINMLQPSGSDDVALLAVRRRPH
jgi:serine phosphatase RsbU (regulator of sigma subunit)